MTKLNPSDINLSRHKLANNSQTVVILNKQMAAKKVLKKNNSG